MEEFISTTLIYNFEYTILTYLKSLTVRTHMVIEYFCPIH